MKKESIQSVSEWIKSATGAETYEVILVSLAVVFITILVVRTFRNKPTI